MSLSPTPKDISERASYELGWVAIHRLLHEGKSWSGREEHCSFWNSGDGRFFNASAVTGLDLPDDARAAARVDWDLDGKSDLWVAGRNSPRLRLFLNRSPNEFAALDLLLRGTKSNRDGIGARVEVTLADGRRLLQTVRAGEGYLAQSSKWLHFGLGASAAIERVRVSWPSPGGATWEEFTGASSAGRFTLVEGSGAASGARPVGRTTLSTGPALSAPSTEIARIWLAARPPLPPLPILASDGAEADARNGVEPPMLVMLWASWCAPCIQELTEFARRADELRAAGVRVIALSADEIDRRHEAVDVLERLQWDFHAGFTTVPTLEALDALQRSVLERRRRTPLPTSFLVDQDRQVAAIYKGPVSVDTLLADVARLRAPATERRDRAAPFGGRWMAPPPTPDWALLELAYVERELEGAAAEVARMRLVSRERSRAGLLNEMGKTRADQGKVPEAIATFEEALANEPDFVEARLNLAYMLHQSGRVAEAVVHYEHALRSDSRNVTALFNLALARCALGQRERAQVELELIRVVDTRAAAELERQIKEYFER